MTTLSIRTMAAAAAMMLTLAANAQNGGISTQMLRDIKAAQQQQPANRALFNALAANSIDNLAKNYANSAPIDTHFSVETKAQSITDQKQSGRCWMFSGLNVLRSRFAQKTDSLRVDFSQNYLFFFDQLEKANLFLQGVIDHARKPIDDQRVQFFFKAPLNDGGTFCGVADLTEKYGLVPAEAMPETFSSDNTSRMSRLISSRLREDGLKLRKMVSDGAKDKDIQQQKTQMLANVWHMLSLTLGTPPTEFTYAFRDKNGKQVGDKRTFTPQQFYQETVGEKLNGSFIMAMNDPRRPYYEMYEVEYDRHTYDGHNWRYVNLPMEDIADMAIASLRDGRKLYTSYDVGKQLDRSRGYCDLNNFDYESLLSTKFTMNKAERIATFDSGSTHAMTLTAVDLGKDGRPLKWKVENSWGAAWGQQGCLIMTARWFREYMFRLVVNKQYVSEKLLKDWQQKPIMVMPEDPLFQEDE